MSSLRLTGRLSISGIDPSSISGSSALPQQRVLLIGSSGSGKTLLLRSFGRACEVCAARRLRRSSVASVMDLEPVALHTVPTTGVENARATFGTTQIFFQEVGAPMAQMWSTYYEKSTLIAFVIDASDFSSLSSAQSELLSLFSTLKSSNFSPPKHLAILLNKHDAADPDEFKSVSRFLNLESLCDDYVQHLSGRGVGGRSSPSPSPSPSPSAPPSAAAPSPSPPPKSAGGLAAQTSGAGEYEREGERHDVTDSIVQVFEVSAVSGKGVEELLEWMCCVALKNR